jgi:ribosomal protein S26
MLEFHQIHQKHIAGGLMNITKQAFHIADILHILLDERYPHKSVESLHQLISFVANVDNYSALSPFEQTATRHLVKNTILAQSEFGVPKIGTASFECTNIQVVKGIVHVWLNENRASLNSRVPLRPLHTATPVARALVAA